MTDPDLVAKKLAVIETSVRELRTLARPEEVTRDVKEQRFVEHTLQVAASRRPWTPRRTSSRTSASVSRGRAGISVVLPWLGMDSCPPSWASG